MAKIISVSGIANEETFSTYYRNDTLDIYRLYYGNYWNLLKGFGYTSKLYILGGEMPSEEILKDYLHTDIVDHPDLLADITFDKDNLNPYSENTLTLNLTSAIDNPDAQNLWLNGASIPIESKIASASGTATWCVIASQGYQENGQGNYDYMMFGDAGTTTDNFLVLRDANIYQGEPVKIVTTTKYIHLANANQIFK